MSVGKEDKQPKSSDVLDTPARRTQEAFSNQEIPKIYANGFMSGHSKSDVYVILERNGQSIAVVNMSFTMAKTLQESLAKTISNIEVMNDHVIMTIDDVNIK